MNSVSLAGSEQGVVRIIILEHEYALGNAVLSDLLSRPAAEIRTGCRYSDRVSRTSWCLSRWLFRETMSDLLGIVEADTMITPGKYGKPYLEGYGYAFNWSHAPGCVALAIAMGQEVGIDIEAVGIPIPDYLTMAEDTFRTDERDWIGTKLGQESWEKFLSLFAQKEAWLKNVGWGLCYPPADAPAALSIPPLRSPGRLLVEVGRKDRYFLAVDASTGPSAKNTRFVIEYLDLKI